MLRFELLSACEKKAIKEHLLISSSSLLSRHRDRAFRSFCVVSMKAAKLWLPFHLRDIRLDIAHFSRLISLLERKPALGGPIRSITIINCALLKPFPFEKTGVEYGKQNLETLPKWSLPIDISQMRSGQITGTAAGFCIEKSALQIADTNSQILGEVIPDMNVFIESK